MLCKTGERVERAEIVITFNSFRVRGSESMGERCWTAWVSLRADTGVSAGERQVADRQRENRGGKTRTNCELPSSTLLGA